MAAIISRLNRLVNLRRINWPALGTSVVLGLLVLVLGRMDSGWPVAMVAVAATEYWLRRSIWRSQAADALAGLVMPLAAGLSAVLVVAVNIRFITQMVVAVAYAVWRWWWVRRRDHQELIGHLLFVQVLIFEGVFLAAAVWRSSDWSAWLMTIWLGIIWLGAFWPTLAVLRARGERAAGVLAAAWAVAATEVSWVLLLWLFTYTSPGGFVLVPQPAVVLVALAYCFGSIYASARGGNLSRGRLVEYLIIGLILILMVIAGTSWRGSI